MAIGVVAQLKKASTTHDIHWPDSAHSVDSITMVFGQFMSNALVMSDAEQKETGAALYQLLSLVNHSCKPNSVCVFGKYGEATLRAVRDLKEGEEITIGYVDLAMRGVERRGELKKGFSFTCMCPLCVKQCESDRSGTSSPYVCWSQSCSRYK
tara:strand:- start:163 stop:621 length:459 start_codon:yes stop_codon:yes gene_type:complete